MRTLIVDSLGETVGRYWQNLQRDITRNAIFRIAVPLSTTPIPIYDWVLAHAHEFDQWDQVEFILMDEQVEGIAPPWQYVPVDDSASYEGFAQRQFIKPLQEITGIAVKVVKPSLAQLADFHMPIDLLILALGVRGNYANVMPDTELTAGWHVTKLLPEFRQAHSNSKEGQYVGSNFREYGMSLGPQQVLKSSNVVVIVSGERKRKLLQELVSYEDFDPQFPLSVIHHPAVLDRVRVYATPDAVQAEPGQPPV